MNLKNIDLESIINKHFPYDTYNPGQYKAIHDSVLSILSNKKHTVLSCPTGVGKSVIGMTIHNVLEELSDTKHETVILATTKGLQDQYNKDFPDLLDLKGKSNYFCHYTIKEGYNSPKCVEKIKSNQCGKDRCPYVIARDSWTAHEGSKTTNSAMMIASHIVQHDEPVQLCIVDECHEIDKVVIAQSAISFMVDDYPECSKYYSDFRNSYYDIINLIKTKLPDSGSFKTVEQFSDEDRQRLDAYSNHMQVTLKRVSDGLSTNPNDYKFVIISQELADLIQKLEYRVGPFYSPLEWVLDVLTEVEETIRMTPIKSSGVLANNKLFNKGEKFLHMSATIGGFETYCSNLGLREEDTNYIEIDNPIPLANRKIVLTNLTKMNRFTDVHDITKALQPIIEKEKGNGIIHTVSFKLANDIYYNMPYHIKKRMLVSNNRKEILELLSRKSDAIILSPSVETGYDFKDDLARWQIIAKVPFLNLGDNYTKTRMNKSNNWYVREAVLRIVQSCGRIVRGMNDYGTTYIIDENILRIITSNTSMFPSWWLDALEMED